MPRLRRLSAILALPLAIGACSDNPPTTPGKLGTCSPAARVAFERLASTSASASTGSLVPLQGATASAEELPSCLSLLSDGATYLVVPQFPTDSGDFGTVDFTIGSQAGAVASLTDDRMAPASEHPQLHFDRMLRRAEHHLALTAPPRFPPHANVVRAQTQQQGSLRTFHVLSNLAGTEFKTATARLEYMGTNIFIYVDTAAPKNGFTSAQLQAFGNLFDKTLYGIDVEAFGTPSDIDGNGHTDVLMSPIVNAITPRSLCTSGFVAGFFFGLDLVPQQDPTNSNAGEIFYTIVPDPDSSVSCGHSVPQLESITPATFLHEFQHMISFNQHFIVHKGPDEVAWLNEGLSHIAESLGSDFYMQKFPPPTGRTNADQLFPDSAEGFIGGDLINSYDYLLNTASLDDTASVTHWPGDGTLVERGAAWLFLRWLGEQKGHEIYKALENTSLTGIANVAQQTGESFPTLFGDFSLALYTDSLPGVSRDRIPPRYRFGDRLPLRQVYARLFETSGPSSDFPRPFPIVLNSISTGGTSQSTMPRGTMSFFSTQAPQSGSPQGLHFTTPAGTPLEGSLHAQVTVFRCPSPAACPDAVNR
jgi:hypothetical protein